MNAAAFPFFSLLADDVRVWTGVDRPTQRQVDLAAMHATARGWNGTTLELADARVEGETETVYPGEDALLDGAWLR